MMNPLGQRIAVLPLFCSRARRAGVLALGVMGGVLGLTGCEVRPVRELAFADVAIRSAQKVKAESLATDQFRRAENLYLRAKKDFSDGYFDTSRKYATEARLAAERAEFTALFKQQHAKVPEGALSPPGEP